uniref:Protein kinase domain-containing protein n=1 Tax=Ananas comosus var. bracteatus TaxID=296719 RepID=A0A6V7QT38_ANACO
MRIRATCTEIRVSGCPGLEIACKAVATGTKTGEENWSDRSSSLSKSVTIAEFDPYTLSVAKNQFTAIGCGDLASFVFPDSEELISICASVCLTRNSVPSDGSCSGVGCCWTTAPIGLRSFDIRLRSLNQTPSWAVGFANKAFVVEREWFRRNSRMLEQQFSSGVDDPSAMDSLAIPAVLDWTLGNSSANSAGVDSTEYSGYRCNWSDGFRGNPYVLNGCQDVDDCEQPETYPCYGICKTEIGSYQCICPPGTYGNPAIERCFSSKNLFTASGVVIAGPALGFELCSSASPFSSTVEGKESEKQLISLNKDIADRMRIFGLKELEKATNDFDKTRILGREGHGTVYKGILSDQRVVAIKRSKIIVQREIDQFINEVAILPQINHRNVVQLFGCCLETEVPLLVYEFISNGTLSNHLHVQGARSLSWDYRLRIAAETARALAYLHSAAFISVFHRDVKSANILLDDNFTAKVSDFGASRSVPLDLDLSNKCFLMNRTTIRFG